MDSIWDDDPKPERVKVKLTKELYMARLRRRLPIFLVVSLVLGLAIRLYRQQGHPWGWGFMLQGVWIAIVCGVVAALISSFGDGRLRR